MAKANLYEDYQPLSEWKDEPENNILVLHLPNFTKEQIHITCVRSSRIVRVTGERQLHHNKWSRFNKTFPVPTDCKLDKIHAKWHSGSLIITMPKDIITHPVALKEESKTAHEAPKAAPLPKTPNDRQRAADKEPKFSKDHQQAADDVAKHSKDQQAAPGKAAETSINNKKIEVQRDAASTKATSNLSIQGEKQTKGQSVDAVSAQKFEKEANLQKGDHQDESSFPKVDSTTTSTMKQKDKSSLVPKAENIDQITKKKGKDGSGNLATEPKKPENVKEKSSDEVKENAFPKTSKKEKEKYPGEEKQKEKKDAIVEKTKEKQSITAAAMKAVKGLAMEQNEDKQLLINMGVAALVIVALGAYVSYSFGSKSKD